MENNVTVREIKNNLQVNATLRLGHLFIYKNNKGILKGIICK